MISLRNVTLRRGAKVLLDGVSVTINPVDAQDAGVSTAPDGGPLSDDITGGTVTFSQPEGRERLDVTCAGGLETFHFNLLAPLEKCAQYAGFLPTAVIESSPGIPELPGQNAVPGFVRLRVERCADHEQGPRFRMRLPASPRAARIAEALLHPEHRHQRTVESQGAVELSDTDTDVREHGMTLL